jgi:anti-sigma B factor antagonist
VTPFVGSFAPTPLARAHNVDGRRFEVARPVNTTAVAAVSPFEASPARRPAPTVSERRSPRSSGTVVTSVAPSTVVVALLGEHDLTTTPAFEHDAAERLGVCDRLVVDLTEATFIDSSVINALARLARQARSRGVTFQVVAPSGSHPRRVLELMSLEGHLGCIDALRDLGAAEDEPSV